MTPANTAESRDTAFAEARAGGTQGIIGIGRQAYLGGYVRPVLPTEPQSLGGVANGSHAGELRSVNTLPSDPARRRPDSDPQTELRAELPSRIAERVVPPTVLLRREESRQDRFKRLAHWEGVVLTIVDGGFIARLTGMGAEPPQEAEFEWADVSSSDRSLVAEGAVFYWTIGYLDARGGQRSRVSTLRFRRLPMWSPQELEIARANALATAKLLEWG